MTKPEFTAKNISSIGGRGKKNPPALLELIRSTLAANADDLSQLMEATGFDAKSISSMLAGAGAHIATGIAALVEHKDKLKEIITVDKTFDAKSISSMLAGAGAHIATAINDIYTRRDKLKALCTKFKSTEIATRLNATATRGLGAEIDAMYDALLPELNGNTMIPADAGAEIAHGSPAALTPEQQVGG